MTVTFSGVIPILPTPFTSKGEVDNDGFASVIDAAITAGVDGVAMFGLASEYYKLSDAERSHLTKLLIRRVANRCSVIISTAPHATRSLSPR
jgi:4-hydroxy-tetrahydrodipicolinate synthase